MNHEIRSTDTMKVSNICLSAENSGFHRLRFRTVFRGWWSQKMTKQNQVCSVYLWNLHISRSLWNCFCKIWARV